MRHGVEKGQAVERNRMAITLFLSAISILPFDHYAAEEYGKVRAELEQKGTPIGPMDTLIAGHARAENLILVTNNTREFFRVENLRIEDWTHDEMLLACRHLMDKSISQFAARQICKQPDSLVLIVS